MEAETKEDLQLKIEDLESRLAQAEQMIEAIKAGEVDAFAINLNNQSEVYTLQSGDYAYRVLIEGFSEGAVNMTEEGLIVYTNTSFHKLIGLPYEKVVGVPVFDFISPESQEEFNRLFAQALTGSSKGEIFLADNGKKIPVYISLTSLQPTLSTVGMIVTDFSEKKKHEEVVLQYQNDLEAKNLQLEHSNAELASFSYVASHDLQEPLRKILVFAKRILEQDNENISAGSRHSIDRIAVASKRMQDLITALFDYSRLTTGEIIYTPTNLDKVLEDVKNNLEELVQDTHTVIEASPLPTLKVIPHQFSQLFSNIIGNAIKYRKQGINPIIKIDAQIVNATEAQVATGPYAQYWRIDIADNGIGFDQDYAERIFEVFQRLHGRVEYEGTGIGLSICKKIAQNHSGHIHAKGQPGVGSVFSIYLPVRD